MDTVLGIDLGTQSLKVMVYDFQAHSVVAAAAAPLTLDRGPGGKAEQLAEDWLKALESALARLDSETRASVRALGVSGQQHGFVAMDETRRRSVKSMRSPMHAAAAPRASRLRETRSSPATRRRRSAGSENYTRTSIPA